MRRCRYCEAHATEIKDIVAMFNLDALAWALPGKRSDHHDDLKPFVVARTSEIGWEARALHRLDAFSGDHSPFVNSGIPACWIWRFPPQHIYYHSAGDVPELLDMDLVTETANVISYSALSLAQTDVPLADLALAEA